MKVKKIGQRLFAMTQKRLFKTKRIFALTPVIILMSFSIFNLSAVVNEEDITFISPQPGGQYGKAVPKR